MRGSAIFAAVGMAALLTSCANTGNDSQDTTSGPTSTAPSPGPATSELPGITFEPCAAIDDAAATRFGFDPSTRNSDDSSFGDRSLISCSFKSYDRMLIVIAQNRPWDELPSTLSGPTEGVTVNGREAIYAVNPVGSDSCAVLMRTDFGALVLDMSLLPKPDSPADLNACDGIMQIAETIEPLIDS